jgi:hypothetical protein
MVGRTLLQTKTSQRNSYHQADLTALVFAGIGSGVAHAQGTMDFPGRKR